MSKKEMAVTPQNNDCLASMPTPSPATGLMNVFSDSKSFEMALRMSDCLSKSTVVPKDYQGNTGNCMIAIEMAARINTSPMMVMQNLYVVNGRPAWSAQWIIAMINSSRRYKTELQFEFGHEATDGGLSCYAWAEDWNGHKVSGPKITMNMANSEGWVNKNGSKWKTMPDVMIQYRAASFFGRMNCPDMIMGIYSQDEVVDGIDDACRDFAITVDEETGEVIETPVIEDKPITQEQRQELFKFAKEQLGDDSNEILKGLIKSEGYDSTSGMMTSALERIIEKIKKVSEERKGQAENEANIPNEPEENGKQ